MKIRSLIAMTLIETLISMAIVAVLFLLVIQSFNAILIGTYLTDARIAVRTQGEFVSEFFKLYAQNADPTTIVCNNTDGVVNNIPAKSVRWQPRGSSDSFLFSREVIDPDSDILGFVFRQFAAGTQSQTVLRETLLTYKDISIQEFELDCQKIVDSFTGQTATVLSLKIGISSAIRLRDVPAVNNVPRFVTVTVR